MRSRLGSLGCAAIGCTALLAIAGAPTACGRAHGVCEGRENELTCQCDADRRQPDGTCCPAWTRASFAGCAERRLTRTRTEDVSGFGAAAVGARGIKASIDDDGRLLLAWMAGTQASPQLYVAEESATATFTLRRPAADLPGSPEQPSVAGGPGARATVAWKQVTAAEAWSIVVSERDDSGAWHDPQSVRDAFSFPPNGFDATLLVTPRAETILAWSQWFDKSYGVLVATKEIAGAWQRPTAANQVISPHTFFTNSPNIAAAADGEVLVTWYQAVPTEHLMAFAAARPPSGPFIAQGADDFISLRGGGDVGAHGTGHPRPAFARDGRAACAWIQGDGQGHDRPFVAFRERGSLVWQRPNGFPDHLGGDAGNAESVQVAYGSSGTLYVVWVQDVGAGPVLLGLTRTKEGVWREGRRSPAVLSSPNAHATTPLLASGPDGAVVLVWNEPENGLVLRRAWDNGGDWGPIEPVASADQKPTSPSLVVGRLGGRVAVAWSEGEGARLQTATID